MAQNLVKKPEALTTDWVLKELAACIDLRSAPKDTITRGEQWKIWLDTKEKTKEDLIAELALAPGKPPEGERITDVPVPFYNPGVVQWNAHKATERVILVAGGK